MRESMERKAHGFHPRGDHDVQGKLLVAALASSVATVSRSERYHTTLVPIGMHYARWLSAQYSL